MFVRIQTFTKTGVVSYIYLVITCTICAGGIATLEILRTKKTTNMVTIKLNMASTKNPSWNTGALKFLSDSTSGITIDRVSPFVASMVENATRKESANPIIFCDWIKLPKSMTTFVRAGTLTFVIVGADVAAGAVVVGADVIITTLGVLGALVMVMLGVGRTSIIVCSKRRKKMPLKHSWIWIMTNYNY